MLLASLIGYFAAVCTTSSFFPQAYKVFRTKHTRDISLSMFLLMTIGNAAWLIYGIMIVSFPMIMANVISILLAFYILLMKLKGVLSKDAENN
jgi:MtN3 and saliva related transmembrane protein